MIPFIFSNIVGCTTIARSPGKPRDPHLELCTDWVDQIYQDLYRERQTKCITQASDILCQTGTESCQREVTEFCRVAVKLEATRVVDQCMRHYDKESEAEQATSTYL